MAKSSIEFDLIPNFDPEAIEKAAQEAARIFQTAFAEAILSATERGVAA